MKNIVIFASGNGTNADHICRYFKNSKTIRVVGILSNKQSSFVVEKAKKNGIPCFVFNYFQLNNTTFVEDLLSSLSVDLIVLAGFLLKIPKKISSAFPKKIINIHPSLLPKYGGRGMYGDHVHEAVIQNSDAFSGFSIHFVNDKYDDGEIILQKKCPVLKNDTIKSLSKKIQDLEHLYYPKTIESILTT